MRKLSVLIIMLGMLITMLGSNYAAADSDAQQKSEPITLEKPPMGYYLSKDVIAKEVKPLKLTQKSKKSNNITDDDKWFKANKLSLNRYKLPDSPNETGEKLPGFVAEKFNDLMLTEAFHDDSYIYCTYGRNYAEGYILTIYSKITKKQVYSFDFSNYRYSDKYIEDDYIFIQQCINWAIVKNNVLYVSHSHNTYAKSSCNQNAYITAISLKNYKILWRSKPLASNAWDFTIINDVIVCGYGFTYEPDYLYELNIYTGKVIKTIGLKSAPSFIIKKGSSLYVRSYNTDYVFKIG